MGLSYFFDFIIYVLLYLLIKKLIKNNFIALISVLIFSPCSLLFFQTFTDLNINFFSAKNVSLTWGRVVLSSRMLFTICYIFVIYYFIKRDYTKYYLFLLFSFFCHPNNSLTISTIFLVYLFFNFVLKKTDLKVLITTFLLVMIGMIPAIYKVSKLSVVNNNLSYQTWYENIIRDEVDDFSIIYNIVHNQTEFIFFLIIFIVLSVCFFLLKNKRHEFITTYYLICSSIFLFICFVVLEVFIDSFNIGHFLFTFIGPFQPGVKILPQSYFLFLFSFSFIISHFKLIKKDYAFLLFAIFLLGNLTIFSLNKFNSNNNFFNQLRYISLIAKTDLTRNPSLYYNSLNQFKNFLNPSYPNIYNYNPQSLENFNNKKIFDIYYENRELKKDPFNQEYRDFKNYNVLINSINENVPKNSKIIVPPYMSSLRDSLEHHVVFFQEKHDGNLMIGSKKIFDIFYPRMKLLNLSYTNLPTEGSKLNYTFMRKTYLDLNEYNFIKIKKNYPGYKYIVTETSHILDFDILYQDKYFKIYEIN